MSRSGNLLHRVSIVFSLSLLTALSLLWFPGRTILQSDTQIYIPILEHMEDAAMLAKDPMAVRPHVSFTIYDEAVRSLRWLTGASFETVLLSLQCLFRFAGIAGIFLLARSIGLSPLFSLSAAALVLLGTVVSGPTVLTVEYEPVPRGFALPLLLLSLGLLSAGRLTMASSIASLGWAFHPPTVMPFWILVLVVMTLRRRWTDVAVLCGGPLIIGLTSLAQPASAGHPSFFARITPELESIQRMRSSYNWVDTWIGRYWMHHSLLLVAALAGAIRIRRVLQPLAFRTLIGLPLLGVVSVAVSWFTLEQLKWLFAAQYQPARYLLFVTLFASLSCALAGLHAASRGRRVEALLFLLVPFLLPLQPDLMQLTPIHLALAFLLAAAAALKQRSSTAAATVLMAFILFPTVGEVVNYPTVMTPDLEGLTEWAARSTSPEAVFQFADVRRGLEPGIFRARAKRAIYADWKAGGQANFLPDFAFLWAERWKQTERPQSLAQYRELGVDYVVFTANRSPRGSSAVWSNNRWAVFRLRQ